MCFLLYEEKPLSSLRWKMTFSIRKKKNGRVLTLVNGSLSPLGLEFRPSDEESWRIVSDWNKFGVR